MWERKLIKTNILNILQETFIGGPSLGENKYFERGMNQKKYNQAWKEIFYLKYKNLTPLPWLLNGCYLSERQYSTLSSIIL